MTEDEKKIFENLEQLSIKVGEELKTSYFKPGSKEPLFVITEKIDGTFTLYRVNGKTLKRYNPQHHSSHLKMLSIRALSSATQRICRLLNHKYIDIPAPWHSKMIFTMRRRTFASAFRVVK